MCGIAGAMNVSNPCLTVGTMVNDCLNNRGQNGAGMALGGGKNDFFLEHSEWDTVDLLRKVSKHGLFEDVRDYYCGIVHTRYGTSGERRSLNNTQPLKAEMSWGKIAIGHNGDSPYAQEDRQALIDQGRAFTTSSDTELMLHYMALSGANDPIASIKAGLNRYRGTYALAMLAHIRDQNETKLIVARDPMGNRPLSLGKLDSGYVVASENSAFERIGAFFERDILPNELLVISKDGLNSQLIDADRKPSSLCMCEYELGYFSRPHSKVFGIPVYAFREKLGYCLGKRYGHLINPGDILSYIPESANFYAKGFSKAIDRDLTTLLVRLHSDRSFIQESPEVIEDTLRRKFGFLRDKAAVILKRNPDRRLWLIDDSMVRGNTARRITRVFRELGFKWIGWLFGEPPLLGPCGKGIDMLSLGGSLIAPKHLKSGILPDCVGIASETEADFVAYLPLQDLHDTTALFARSVGFSKNDFCFGCFEKRGPKFPFESELR